METCAACGHANREGAAFCGGCGQSLRPEPECPACGATQPPGQRFCDACGARLEPAESDADSSGAASPSPAKTPAPRFVSSGRYELSRALGEGARKQVFLAHDQRLDRDVALALIKTEGLDAAGRTRVRREAQAMGRLGDHPHIVTAFDVEEDGEQLFIVSEFMEGGDLEGELRSAEGGRLAVERAVRIGRELCGALAHAHARGVIHRDLKPGNVWLASDGTAKLGDFGLAVALEHSRLTQEGMMVGTPAYMPPEQALGGTMDPKSDLYALGATLYEILTGRAPFLGDDAVAIISQHIHTPPVAPSWHNPEIPKRLEALILELLAKDPLARPATAEQVRTELERALSASAEAERPSEPARVNPLDRLESGVFVGREEQLTRLRAGCDEALSGHGRVLLLVGEPGIGKTRTAEELATYARLRGAQVLWGRCYEGDGAPAFWPWMQMVRAWVRERPPETLLSLMGPGAADIAEVVSEVRERLPGLPVPPRLEPEQARFRLFDSVTHFLKNAARAEPLVLVLDDLHWGDRPSLLLLQFLARELEGSRLVVVGTYRDVELGRQHPLEETLAALAREQRSERILLRGLGESDVGRFIELTASRTPPPALVAAVYRETEGNPFFVHEVVRLLQRDGRLDQLESVGSWSIEIPQGVRQVVGRRLDALSEACNELLRSASVIGREFDLQLLADVAREPAEDVLERLEEAESARLIEETGPGAGGYRFAHALVRETLYDEIRTARRVRLHRAIAEALEQRHAERPEPQLASLSYHFCEAAPGGDAEKALDYAERAAARAKKLLAYEEAAGHLERALSVLEGTSAADERRRGELLVQLGNARRGAGLPDASREAYRSAQDLARRMGWSDLFAVAAVADTDALYIPASAEMADPQPLEEALRLLGDENLPLRLHVTARLALQLLFIDGARARGLIDEALPLAREGGGERALVEILRAAETVKPWATLESARGGRPELVQLATRLGDRFLEADARLSDLMWLIKSGDRERVDPAIARYDALATELRHPGHLSTAAGMRASLALLEGRLRDAAAEARASWQEGSRSNPEQALQLYGLQGFVLNRLRGRLERTEEPLAVGVERYAGNPLWLCLQALMFAETGRPEEGRRVLEQARASDFVAIPLQRQSSVALLADVVAADRRPEGADEFYQQLLPSAGTIIAQGNVVATGANDRCLGNLAAVQGRFDQAFAHFEAAMGLERRARARGWLPRTQIDYARALLERGESGDRERARAQLDASLDTSRELGLRAWLDLALALKLRLQGIDSGSLSAGHSIDVVAASIGVQRPDLSSQAAPDGTVTLMFSDMAGFTEMTERLGDLAAREVIRQHNRVVREQLAAHGGHEVELQGDGFLLAFADARRGLECAIALQRAFEQRNRSATEPIRVRIGLHTGQALRDADRFFGRTVILAARIADQAVGGEILVSSALQQLGEGAGDLRFGAGREVALKGIAEPQQLVRLEWD